MLRIVTSIGLALSSACFDTMYLVVLRVHSKYSCGLARGQLQEKVRRARS
uniref:Predicted protein n=1 Tax=Hordeum vulgare subsp. vulgare TaxID=112509 RepID=F2E0C4_HORVV|nr:predicted protein [Hordeum vulgare subsp. vulgare]